MAREKAVYFAKLAEQAERYDEMADYMKEVAKCSDDLTVEERNLLSVAYKNAVGSRRAAWRIITSVENKEKSKGNEEQAKHAVEYCEKVEAELHNICQAILELLNDNLVPAAKAGESKVFYQKMTADYHRYLAEFVQGDEKAKAAENAREAYDRPRLMRRRTWRSHTPSDWAWPSTIRSSCTRSSASLTMPARWLGLPSKTRSLSWTTSLKIPTRTPL